MLEKPSFISHCRCPLLFIHVSLVPSTLFLLKTFMFAHLKGTVDAIELDHVVIDVGGVGYFVHASKQTLSKLEEGEATKIFVETLMRQESLTLYGFGSKEEQAWFNLLLSVQGVGPKVALGILGSMTLDELAAAIVHQDKAMISRGDGVGPKLAGRILLELKDKCKNIAVVKPSELGGRSSTLSLSVQDAISALQNLGYSQSEAMRAIQQIDHPSDMDSASLIRLCLQSLRTPIEVRR